MTVTSTTAKSGPYNGNGVLDTFDYTFYIASESELKITLTDSDGVDTVQTITTHYTVTISADGTGTFTMVTPPATGEKVTATLDVDLTQGTDLLNLGQFSAETHEDMSDKLTRIAQQLSEKIDRCLKLGQSSDLDPEDVTLANLADQVMISTTNFANVLTSADDTLQEALETLDGGFSRVPVLLDSASPSGAASATVNSASVSSYDKLRIEINLTTLSGLVAIQFTDAGGTPLTTANYSYISTGLSEGGTTISDNAVGATYIDISAEPDTSGSSGAGTDVFSFTGELSGIAAGVFSQMRGSVVFNSTGIGYVGISVMGVYATGPQLLGGVKVYDVGGNFDGTVRLWGLPTGS